MNPAFHASKVYQSEPCSNTFWQDLDAYLASGFVHSTPGFFVMARPVSSKWDTRYVTNPLIDIPYNELTLRPDMWHIALMAGDMREAWSLFPYQLPLISMERKNKLHIYDYERFKRTLFRLGKFPV